MLRRLLTTLLTTLLGAAVAAFVVVGAGVPAHAAKPGRKAPACPHISVEDSAKAATAVFSGMVSDQQKQPRTDGQPGAIYVQTVTVTLVYRGEINTETVQVQTERNRNACSLGALELNRDYMFFVSGTGEPWMAAGTSGTRPENHKVDSEVTDLLGEGVPPVQPPPETAEFTPVDTAQPRSLSRSAAPGAALMIVGLLGLVVVRFVRTRA